MSAADDLADINDPRVTAARALIARIDKQKHRNDRTGADLENRAIAGQLRDFISDSGAGLILSEIYHAETRNSGDDDAAPSDPASTKAFQSTTIIDSQRGVAGVMQYLLPAFLSADRVAPVLSEFLAPYVGKATGFALQKERDGTIMTDATRRWLVLIAWYRAGREGGGWLVHLQDISGMGKHTAQAWSKYASEDDKDAAKEAGRLRKQVGNGLPIPEPYASMERNILRQEAGRVLTLQAKFRRGDYSPI